MIIGAFPINPYTYAQLQQRLLYSKRNSTLSSASLNKIIRSDFRLIIRIDREFINPFFSNFLTKDLFICRLVGSLL